MREKILVIDDDLGIRDTSKLMLEKHGYEVVTAENGFVGLEIIKKQRPDLILLDVLMPQMDGYTFYKELKKKGAMADIPVLVITARGMMEDSFRVMGVDGFIAKPVLPEVLIQEIENILEISRIRRTINAPGIRSVQKKIMLVGKDAALLENMATQARRAGYESLSILSGVETIALAVKFMPDAVFVNIQMSDMPAAEIVDILRRLPQMETKPIIGYCFYETDNLGDAQIRRSVLGIEEASKKFLEAGGTHYMGRYNQRLFLKTAVEYLNAKLK